jgi:hypothetical protein
MFSICSWALLAVGVIQITTKVYGSFYFWLPTSICACAYGFFLTKSPDTKGRPRSILIAVLYCAILLLIGNVVFGYLVFIAWDNRWIGLSVIVSIVFFGIGLLSSAIISKILRVT